ncbi:unnamed protein product [Schistosoma rodhaini]|uniref:Uncharacterized protein n=1 Tax=Schistosoma rodhaini TaxID=6188 RepID=A0AA85EJA0_9TREM|nr:unnamed protein product [Schistosoma rodhaini]
MEMKVQVILILALSFKMVMNRVILVGGDCKLDCLKRSLMCDDRCKRMPFRGEICYLECRDTLSECLDKPCAKFAEDYYGRYS